MNACISIHEQTYEQSLAVSRSDRAHIKQQRAKVIWFTGLSASGKSTIANALELALHSDGKHTYILDGDNVRKNLNKDLGFGPECRSENIRRIAEVALLMNEAGLIVIVTCISPFEKDRELARKLIGEADFFEVYVNTPIEVCEQRDPKGLYKKARSGLMKNMTGIDSPYEAPRNPSLLIDTSVSSLSDSVSQILRVMSDGHGNSQKYSTNFAVKHNPEFAPVSEFEFCEAGGGV